MKTKILLISLMLVFSLGIVHVAMAQDDDCGGCTDTPAPATTATPGTAATNGTSAQTGPTANLSSTPATAPTAGGPTDTTLNYSGLVKCDGVIDPSEPNRKTVCGFPQLFLTINTLITFLFQISIPITVVLFAYGGVLYMTGKESNIKTARRIFVSVGIGFIIMLTMWVAVYQVVNWFVNSNSGATSLIQNP